MDVKCCRLLQFDKVGQTMFEKHRVHNEKQTLVYDVVERLDCRTVKHRDSLSSRLVQTYVTDRRHLQTDVSSICISLNGSYRYALLPSRNVPFVLD